MKNIKIFDTLEDFNNSVFNAYTPLLAKVKSEGSGCYFVGERFYRGKYLTLTAIEDGTFTFTMDSGLSIDNFTYISYSVDNGKTWVRTNNANSQTITATTPTITAGNSVIWKGEGIRTTTNTASSIIGLFSSTGQFNAAGNVMSILFGDDFESQKTLTTSYALGALFKNCTGLINAKNVMLPATTVGQYCYVRTFDSCTNMLYGPTTLPATTFTSQYCYFRMFNNCSKLISGPLVLPATTLTSSCYASMFESCSNLIIAPKLLATNFGTAQAVYNGMFALCKSLVIAPELPALTLTDNCYKQMFNGCTKLNYIKMMATDISASNCLSSWVNNVQTQSGTFVKNAAAEWTATGASGIPNNWTVETAVS